MKTIEIDFDVFKELTVRRDSEEMTENDVIRDLLGLDKKESTNKKKEEDKADFVSKNIIFPHGTKLRAHYKGKYYIAEIVDGFIVYNGKQHTSPSSAAKAVTGTNVNGWIFWECRRPKESNWTDLDKLKRRGSQHVR
ncbi:DUF2924 domain-containing protein [Gracilimonas sp.]|uniref:DUF2924 domain-containing protein n=1 Tax=Gracilimonas sp. TaxID=1974203 RepID=UPI003D0C88AF